MRVSHACSVAGRVVPVLLIGLWSAACADGNAPPPAEVRVQAITPTALTGTVGSEVQPVPAVRATDDNDRPLGGIAITFEVAGGGTIPSATVTTGVDGSAGVGAWTLGPFPGSHTLTAGAGGRADVTFTALAAAGPLAGLMPVSGDGQIVDIGEALDRPLVARAVDAFGNLLAGIPVTFAVTAGGGTIPGGEVLTGPNGLAVSGVWTLGAEAGVQTATASSGTAQGIFRAHALPPPAPLEGRIAFVSLADPLMDVATVNVDGSGFTRLNKPGFDLQVAWSPDGSRLAVANDDQATAVTLYTMTPAGTSRTRVTDGPLDLDPAWSPDGTTIAFTTQRNGSAQIAALNTVTGREIVLVDDPSYDGQPAWSPDGRKLAIVSDWGSYDFSLDIFTVNADGTGRTQLTFGARNATLAQTKYYQHPVWSPDGSMIAFVVGSQIRPGDTRYTIGVMSPDGVLLKNLAWAGDMDPTTVSDPGSLTWSPDGRAIAYSFIDCDLVTNLGCSRERSVRYVSLDGRQEGTIVTNAHGPSWR